MRVPIAAILACLLLAACAAEKELPPERWVPQELGTRAAFRDVFFLDELDRFRIS